MKSLELGKKLRRSNNIIFTILQGIEYFVVSLVLGFLVFSLLFYMQNMTLWVAFGCCLIVTMYLVFFFIVVFMKFFEWFITRW